MQCHEFDRGFTVMDGKRVVATARKHGNGVWMMTLRAGCWIDSRTDTARVAHHRRTGFNPAITDHLRVAKNKADARKWMRALATQ